MGEAEDVIATGLDVSCATMAMPFLLNDLLRVNQQRRRHTKELLLAFIMVFIYGTPVMTGADSESTYK